MKPRCAILLRLMLPALVCGLSCVCLPPFVAAADEDRRLPQVLKELPPNIATLAEQVRADQRRPTIRQVSLFHRHFADTCMRVLPENLVLGYLGIVATDNGRRRTWIETTEVDVGCPLTWHVVDPQRLVIFEVTITTKATPLTVARCCLEGQDVFANVPLVDGNRSVDDKLPELGGRSVRKAVSEIQRPGPRPGIILPQGGAGQPGAESARIEVESHKMEIFAAGQASTWVRDGDGYRLDPMKGLGDRPGR